MASTWISCLKNGSVDWIQTPSSGLFNLTFHCLAFDMFNKTSSSTQTKMSLKNHITLCHIFMPFYLHYPLLLSKKDYPCKPLKGSWIEKSKFLWSFDRGHCTISNILVCFRTQNFPLCAKTAFFETKFPNWLISDFVTFITS